MSILVSGSLAYDHIMDFQGYFKDHILPEKVHIINVSFLVNSLRKQRGGCGPNIAYNLALLGERPLVVGTVGHDFADYQAWLDEAGVDTSGIKVIPDEFTASCFITTDKSSNQITGFYPGAMNFAHDLHVGDFNPSEIQLAIISPNDPQAMVSHVKECQELNVPYIYDPGQQVIFLEGPEMLEAMKGSRAVIGNDYELGIIEKKTGLTPSDLLQYTDLVIVTRGEFGSTLITAEHTVDAPVAREKAVVDPTGGGDAYRAGIIKGLLNGYSLEQMGRVAALTATYCIENYGTQSHAFTSSEFLARYNENFPDVPLPEATIVERKTLNV
ncbi:MAG: carbohydrate kinase family protein [Chloroflexi bacterium]|nr:carbohydrate kinase family protein [Chloroflexota bacterium]OJV88731.1 MAG: ribokinase [Chloroflexi bacterium 54-19]